MKKILLSILLSISAFSSQATNVSTMTVEDVKNARLNAISKQLELEAAKAQAEITKLNTPAESGSHGSLVPASPAAIQLPKSLSSAPVQTENETSFKLEGVYGLGTALTAEISNADRSLFSVKEGEEIENGWITKEISEKSVVITKKISDEKFRTKKECSKKHKCKTIVQSFPAKYKTMTLRRVMAMPSIPKELATTDKTAGTSSFPNLPNLPFPALPRIPK
ncbi:hypothetical protein R6242_16070 [Iodobacter sp. CM08]|uniref:hypothetical protein n=1 Tax=Iodobacter sp. CM08 TaxID=3085902 RepID=UPI0029815401|nr:hypothetical protein [Iodobacter sp. CM08]MDW5418083.1 hypothetical protein [Iodobacter sp. CM08]